MELGEHSPSQGGSAQVPIVLCERPLSTPHVWCWYGVNVPRSGWGPWSLHTLHEWADPLVTPLTQSLYLSTSARPTA